VTIITLQDCRYCDYEDAGLHKTEWKGNIMNPRRDTRANLRKKVGLQGKDSKTVTLRVAASILLCVAVLGQMGYARSRLLSHTAHRSRCTMGLSEMKEILERTLGKYAVVSDSDKAFVHLQHQQMSCEEYTRKYENSDFFSDSKTRAAIANWHWNTYHSEESATRSAAVQSVEASLIAQK
jgi:hypothetical protein